MIANQNNQIALNKHFRDLQKIQSMIHIVEDAVKKQPLGSMGLPGVMAKQVGSEKP